jgi:2-methylcitrate dehydratase PrpD
VSVQDTITKHLVETNYKALSAETVEASKKQILDMLGVMIAGSTCSISDEMNGLVDLVKDWGGKKESTILAFGGQVPAPNAALVNGTLCVRRDFDDTNLIYGGGHASRAIVPTAFAMAERQGGITGKEFITAVALGHDLECRIAAAAGRGMGSWYMISNFFGAAATAGKILGLNEKKMGDTLAFAFHQMCGASTGGSAGLGSLKGVSNGFCCKAGIESALLADKGFTVDWDIFDPKSRSNFYERFFNGGYTPLILTSDLGKMFVGAKTSEKEFPCCHGQHMTLKATLGLLKEHKVKPEDITEVIFHVNLGDYFLLGDPVEKKQNPQNIIQAQFSLCWGVASAIVYGEVGIKNFTEEALHDVRIQELAKKVFGKPEVELRGTMGILPATVEIKLKNGKVFSKQTDQLFGTPENPMSLDNVATKFRYCCQYSVKPIPKENQDKVIQMVKGLERVSDVSQIVRLLG